MNKIIPILFLLVGLSACDKNSKPAPAPADPFLGHWQAESLRGVSYDATGKILDDQSRPVNAQIDVTATTITFTSVVGGRTFTETDPYTRSGEVLTITVMTPIGETHYARNLTTNSFTYEYDSPRVSGMPYYINTTPYHR